MAKAKKDPIDDVSVEIVDMTPDFAEELLASNTHNRKMKGGVIQEYVSALTDGDWQFNGDPVRVAQSGRLLDGQHRLMAIVESGVTIPVVLIEGLPDKAQMTMDVGAKRSYIDHLRLSGETHVTRLASVVRTYALYKQYKGKTRWPGGGVKTSFAMLDRTLDANPKLRDSAVFATQTYQQGIPISTAALGVAHYVFERIDHKDATFFWDRAISGTGLYADGPTQPILKFREFVANRQVYDHQKAMIGMGGIFKAWNAYRQGSKLTTAAPRFGGAKPEPFPWPS